LPHAGVEIERLRLHSEIGAHPSRDIVDGDRPDAARLQLIELVMEPIESSRGFGEILGRVDLPAPMVLAVTSTDAHPELDAVHLLDAALVVVHLPVRRAGGDGASHGRLEVVRLAAELHDHVASVAREPPLEVPDECG
jgi:hypothetical protein